MIEGAIFCPKCSRFYPIMEEIPIMLPDDLRDKKQRPGRNPKTGEEIPIKARRVVTFRPGQKLKARVEGYVGTEEQ